MSRALENAVSCAIMNALLPAKGTLSWMWVPDYKPCAN